MQQTAQPREHLLFLLGTSFACKGVVVVAWESAREILAHVAVRHLFRAVHHNLSTVVELWYATYRHEQGQCLFQHQRVASVAQESVGVVVVDEGHDMRGIYIQIVVDERVVQAVHPLPPRIRLFVLGLRQFVEEREVHHRLQVRVVL